MKRAALLLLYALVCAVEFLAAWAKDVLGKRIKGEKDEKDDG